MVFFFPILIGGVLQVIATVQLVVFGRISSSHLQEYIGTWVIVGLLGCGALVAGECI